MSKKATLADLLNDMTFQTTFNRLKNLAMNIFVWDGLPEGMKQEYIEEALFTHGQALFFKDRNLGYMCLKCSPDGGFNVYNEPVAYRAFGHNYNERYDVDEVVNIRNNALRTPTRDFIMLYTNKLTEIERTMDVNVKAMKTPYIITCDEKDLLTFKNIYKQVDGNIPAIFADKNLNLSSIDVLETKAEFLCDRLADYRHDVTNEVLTFLGINNANTDKRERLITDEVNANQEFIGENVRYMLEARQKACEEINTLFPDLNISCDVKVQTVAADPSEEEAEEGEDVGEV